MCWRPEGLTNEEFFWRPVPDCWTIHQDRPGHWTYDYAIPDPRPARATTIGWQLVHLGTCKLMYHEWAYGQARLTWPEVRVPGTAGEALHLREEGHTTASGRPPRALRVRPGQGAQDQLGGDVAGLAHLFCRE